MPKVLVTGVNGFVGKHLIRELYSRGAEVVGLGHNGPADPEIAGLLKSYEVCDLTDSEAISALPLDDIGAVVNLAGLAGVGASFDEPEKYKHINVAVVTNIGEQLLKNKLRTRLVAISTGAIYDPGQRMPLTENSRTIDEGSPYALSKLLMEEAVSDLKTRGLDTVIVRPFNHSGPGQREGFLIPDLYKKLLTAKETNGTVKVGSLDTRRDYADVRDIVRAYADLALSDRLNFDIYNLCSGESRSGQEIMNILLKELNLAGKITIKEDPSLLRPSDPKELYGSYERIGQEIGWQPQISLEQTIHDFVANASR